MSLSWIVFDYGEVISQRTRALPALASELGVAPADLKPAYFDERIAYDRGHSDLAYWRAVGAHVGVTVDAALAERLTAIDVEGWSQTQPETVELIGELRSAGYSLALLSNAPSSFGRDVERQQWTRQFEHMLFSGDLELVKPDPEIYRVLLATLRAPAAECLFFDDRQENIDAARDIGMHADLWRDVDTARRLLRARSLMN